MILFFMQILLKPPQILNGFEGNPVSHSSVFNVTI